MTDELHAALRESLHSRGHRCPSCDGLLDEDDTCAGVLEDGTPTTLGSCGQVAQCDQCLELYIGRPGCTEPPVCDDCWEDMQPPDPEDDPRRHFDTAKEWED